MTALADDPQFASERALIGAAITSTDLALAVLETVQPKHMVASVNQTILDTVRDLVGRGHQISPMVVISELAKRGEKHVLGDGSYLPAVVEQAALPAQIGFHGRAVRHRVWKQNLALLGSRCSQLAGDGATEVDDDLELVNGWLDEMAAVPGDHGTARAADLVYDVIEEIELGTGDDIVRTGFADLDTGLTVRPGQLVVIGARPGVGKTTAALDWARHVGIKLRQPVYFLSLEMSRTELMKRMISAEARVNLASILHHTQKDPRLSDDDWSRIQAAAERIQQSGIVLDDTSGAGIAHVRARLRHLKRQGGVRLAIVDYLGILSTPGRQENRQQAVAELTRGLKQLAREINIPVVVLAQLNRMVEQRTDRRPMVSDLKDSGAIEADADVVILLHREDVYDKESPRAGEIDLLVDKSRHGPQFVATAAYQGHYCRIADMAPDPSAQGPFNLRRVS